MQLSNVMYMMVVSINRDVRLNNMGVFLVTFFPIIFLVGVVVLPFSFDCMVKVNAFLGVLPMQR